VFYRPLDRESPVSSRRARKREEEAHGRLSTRRHILTAPARSPEKANPKPCSAALYRARSSASCAARCARYCARNGNAIFRHCRGDGRRQSPVKLKRTEGAGRGQGEGEEEERRRRRWLHLRARASSAAGITRAWRDVANERGRGRGRERERERERERDRCRTAFVTIKGYYLCVLACIKRRADKRRVRRISGIHAKKTERERERERERDI